jgi:hypothetical protein
MTTPYGRFTSIVPIWIQSSASTGITNDQQADLRHVFHRESDTFPAKANVFEPSVSVTGNLGLKVGTPLVWEIRSFFPILIGMGLVS